MISTKQLPQNGPAQMHNESAGLSDLQIQKLVEEHGYTKSLASSLNKAKENFARRYWIIDNSSSMSASDGHRIEYHPGSRNVKITDCSRWEEIQSCVQHQIGLSSLLEAPTRFRLLNKQVSPETLSIGENASSWNTDYDEKECGLLWINDAYPRGLTPLTRHIQHIQREIKAIEPQLRQQGQRVSITIATDGLPTSSTGHSTKRDQNDFVESLRMLEGLPIWLVIRLCTDDDDIVNFYNQIDEVLELSIDVLDDFQGEAHEVYEVNPWLNYGVPLHRMREMGHHDRLFDLIDERKLTPNEIRDFCILLFGQDAFDGAPDPSADWKGFCNAVEKALETTPEQWNPIKKRYKPLVSVKKLKRMYGNRFW